MKHEELIELAMQMIIYAGDARSDIKNALDAMMEDKKEEAGRYMANAQKALAQAHHCQTDVIQEEARGEMCEYSMLFTHAQDTLMTIYSEYHLAEKIRRMYDLLNEKIEKIEKRIL